MLPSIFFFPAIPVILDEPSSIATINSFAAMGFVFFLSIISFMILFLAYNLVVELQTDIGVLVPTGF